MPPLRLFKAFRRPNPKSIGVFPRTVPQRRHRRRQISGDRSLCSDTLPGRGSALGAISIGLHRRLPWVIHLRETCYCSTNLCTWRPNTVYKNRRVRRHQALFWRRCRGGKVKGTRILLCECLELFPLDSAIISFCFLFLFSLVRLNGK
jgi:hypothetical protein